MKQHLATTPFIACFARVFFCWVGEIEEWLGGTVPGPDSWGCCRRDHGELPS